MLNRTLMTALMAGALVCGATAATAQDTRLFDPARDNYNYPVTTNALAQLTGEVTSIQGLKFLTLTPEGEIIGVDMAEMPYNPTDPSYDPPLETGDTVTLTGYVSSADPAEIVARDIVSIRKPWNDYASVGQRLIDSDAPEMIAPAAGDMTEDNLN